MGVAGVLLTVVRKGLRGRRAAVGLQAQPLCPVASSGAHASAAARVGVSHHSISLQGQGGLSLTQGLKLFLCSRLGPREARWGSAAPWGPRPGRLQPLAGCSGLAGPIPADPAPHPGSQLAAPWRRQALSVSCLLVGRPLCLLPRAVLAPGRQRPGHRRREPIPPGPLLGAPHVGLDCDDPLWERKLPPRHQACPSRLRPRLGRALPAIYTARVLAWRSLHLLAHGQAHHQPWLLAAPLPPTCTEGSALGGVGFTHRR